jgi:ABC-2 type transport system ATP-binding protein
LGIAVDIKNIGKSYNNVQALKNISLKVNESELFGFIGPDGAGKTTLFRILTTLLLADEGKASIYALDVVQDYKKLRTLLGYMPGKFSLYQEFKR